MNPLKIGIVGGGIAGSAAAHFLSKQGHDITVFEREETPKPLGAGIMLQPTGFKVLSLLGFRELLEENANLIYHFKGIKNQRDVVIDLNFEKLYEGAFGRGVHRGLLFYTLIKSLYELNQVVLHTGVEIVKITQNEKKVTLNSSSEQFDDFDFVIVSNGSRSLLRENFKVTKVSKQQAVSALWATIPYFEGELNDCELRQFYDDKTLSGLMPIGKNPLGESELKIVNFFWGINQQTNPINSTADFKLFREKMLRFYGKDASVVERIIEPEQLIFAPYYDSQLSAFHEGRVAFIGDVAHSMSPQLSSGTNLALLDALELANNIAANTDLHTALRVFSRKRTKQVHYYQFVSRLVTPVFQGDEQYPFLRDVLMQKMYEFPLSRKILLSTLMGIRNGLFSNLDETYYI